MKQFILLLFFLRAVSRQPFGALESYVPLHNGEIALYRAVREAVPIVDAALMKIIRLVGGFVVRCPERTVQEELAFVESYLYLEHIRFGDALHVEIEDDLRNHHCLVIPASIQMLVENALKHNISTKKSPLIVHISIGNEGITVRNNLQLRNYVASNGAGLKNMQRQYALYGMLVEILKDEKEFVVKLPFVGEDVNRLSTI